MLIILFIFINNQETVGFNDKKKAHAPSSERFMGWINKYIVSIQKVTNRNSNKPNV